MITPYVRQKLIKIKVGELMRDVVGNRTHCSARNVGSKRDFGYRDLHQMTIFPIDVRIDDYIFRGPPPKLNLGRGESASPFPRPRDRRREQRKRPLSRNGHFEQDLSNPCTSS
jgi:hypothetical protein